VPDLRAYFNRRHENWVLACMLLVLHAALDAGLDSALSSALMTAHLGLFFMWQPIWQQDQRLQLSSVALIALLVVALVATLSWWSVFAWMMLLIGMVAGRSFSTRQERFVYMITLAFLISEFLISCTSSLFLGGVLGGGIGKTFQFGLYLLPMALFAFPAISAPQRDPFAVDFFRGITFTLLTALLAVFSVLMTLRLNIAYPLALVATLMALSMLLFFLSWMTTPGQGNIGLLAVWEKSVLNIGTPFEAWLGNIANLAAQSVRADDFLAAAVAQLNDIPWVCGLEWSTGFSHGIEGRRSQHYLDVEAGDLKVTLFAEREFSAALLIHGGLLIQVLGHFYAAKRRENEEASEAHLRAIYETGARVTHDVKNLLQTMNTLAGSLQVATTDEQKRRGFDLLKRRLPDIARRLQFALDKLERPEANAPLWVDARVWWDSVIARVTANDVHCAETLGPYEWTIPADCFDSVLDNLIDNARNKIAAGDGSGINVSIEASATGVTATVTDDGSAINERLGKQLFRGPVESRTGLGIGLYQAARQAQLSGCELNLNENRDGEVGFALFCPATGRSSGTGN
jgi:signal transduction histidine kinase